MTNLKSIARTACIVLAVSFATIVLAQEDEKQAPPVGGTPKDFTLPATDTFGLENGLQATLVPFGSVPKSTVRVIVRSGNLNEGDQTWLA